MKDEDFDLRYNIAAGKHFYQFYKSLDDYLQVITSFLQAGLEKGQAGVWVASENKNLHELKAYALAQIPNAESYFDSGRLQICSGEEWYLKHGRFDEDQAIQNTIQCVEALQQKGFSIVRGCGDAAAIPREDWQRVQMYEKKIGCWIKENAVIGLCAYPILECSLNETKAVLENHDDVLVHHL